MVGFIVFLCLIVFFALEALYWMICGFRSPWRKRYRGR